MLATSYVAEQSLDACIRFKLWCRPVAATVTSSLLWQSLGPPGLYRSTGGCELSSFDEVHGTVGMQEGGMRLHKAFISRLCRRLPLQGVCNDKLP